MVFSTQRTIAREWTRDDLELAKELWGNPKVTNLISSSPLTNEDIKKKLEEQIRNQVKYGLSYWVILERGSNHFIGCGGLRPYQDIHEIGFHITEKFWGRGLATEIALGIIEHSRSIGLQKLFAGHNPKNNASKRVLEKVGFKYLRDEFYEPTGLMHPSYELDLRS